MKGQYKSHLNQMTPFQCPEHHLQLEVRVVQLLLYLDPSPSGLFYRPRQLRPWPHQLETSGKPNWSCSKRCMCHFWRLLCCVPQSRIFVHVRPRAHSSHIRKMGSFFPKLLLDDLRFETPFQLPVDVLNGLRHLHAFQLAFFVPATLCSLFRIRF